MQTTQTATPVLEVAHLEKVYGALGNVTRALNDVSFTVENGEILGFLGRHHGRLGLGQVDVAQLRVDHR